jgi:hypothetical protein
MPSEAVLRRLAKEQGYRIEKHADRYSLIDDEKNAAMFHFQNTTLEHIAEFFEGERPHLAVARDCIP